jgi:hypothetical protein
MPQLLSSPIGKAARTAIVMGVVAMLIFSVTRFALMLYSGTQAVPFGLWLGVMAKGMLFDLLVSAVLVSPLLAYTALLPNRWRGHKVHRALRWAGVSNTGDFLITSSSQKDTFGAVKNLQDYASVTELAKV